MLLFCVGVLTEVAVKFQKDWRKLRFAEAGNEYNNGEL